MAFRFKKCSKILRHRHNNKYQDIISKNLDNPVLNFDFFEECKRLEEIARKEEAERYALLSDEEKGNYGWTHRQFGIMESSEDEEPLEIPFPRVEETTLSKIEESSILETTLSKSKESSILETKKVRELVDI